MNELQTAIDDMRQTVATMDYSPVLTDFNTVLAEQHAGMFAGQHDSTGTQWEPLKPFTIAKKGHSQILFESGDLRESLIHVGGPGNIAEVTPKTALFGTSIAYAMFHQEGTSRMPARPPVGISEESIDQLTNMVADATVERMRG